MAIIASTILLGCIGCAGAIALNFTSKKFRVHEDPRIDAVEQLLPGANCGACGLKGCRDFASQCVKRGSLDGLYCPGAGQSGMEKIGALLGLEAPEALNSPIAIVRCQGTNQTKTPLDAQYCGPRKCTLMDLQAGNYQCANSCLGCGDCADACPWEAISISTETGLPEVIDDKCVGCGKCAQACPRSIIEIRHRGTSTPKGMRRVWVACSNCLKGAEARKQCSVACIGCGLCAKACPFDAITITNNLAHINAKKCKSCGKCINACPAHAILATFKMPSKTDQPL